MILIFRKKERGMIHIIPESYIGGSFFSFLFFFLVARYRNIRGEVIFLYHVECRTREWLRQILKRKLKYYISLSCGM
jgi:hypothetical protein